MVVVVDAILLAAAAVLAVPTLVLAGEVAASLLARARLRGAGGTLKAVPDTSPRGRVGVVIPAHNEQAVLLRTLALLIPQLRDGDRLIVVADNCNDETADIARGAGAVCVERHDRVNRGKGYALDAGVRRLGEEAGGGPPEVVIFTDADVAVAPGAIDMLVRQVQETGRPAQGEYLMESPANARSVDLVSRFAFTLKNMVRPLGLWQLGWPVPLFGAGMAFPWATIAAAPLASGDIVEDMRLGIDLCRRGQSPLYCPAARFRGVLPGDASDADAQRRRWEHGHLSVFRDVPALLAGGLRRRDGRTLAMALDHLVPPLTVLCAELLVVFALASIWWLARGGPLSASAAGVAAGCVGLMGLALVVAWAAHMRGQIPAKAMLGLPRYVISRAGNQVGWLFRRQETWVRTPRAEERELAHIPSAHVSSAHDPSAHGTVPLATPGAANGSPPSGTAPGPAGRIGTASAAPADSTSLVGVRE